MEKLAHPLKQTRQKQNSTSDSNKFTEFNQFETNKQKRERQFFCYRIGKVKNFQVKFHVDTSYPQEH